mgnify:CR=1 FL=1
MIQIPTDVPNPDNNTPIDLTNIVDILLYIVAPIVLIVFYILLRKQSRKKQNDQSEDN